MSSPALTRALEPAAAVQLVEQGLAWTEAEYLANQLGVGMTELADLLGISQPTFFRRRRQKRFSTQESDHIMRFARLWHLAVDVFGQDEGARQWLKAPELLLGGKTPLDFARTETGAHEVEALLRRIDYGIAL
jgi:putative toxin-antitoxin system antitoxin component (TIGR02293 family)